MKYRTCSAGSDTSPFLIIVPTVLALRQAELLFDTLLHSAFRGELGGGDGGVGELVQDNGTELVGELVQMGLGLA